MIRKSRKWVALLVAFTFIWLLPVYDVPLSAANHVEKVKSLHSDEGAGFIGAEGHRNTPAKKKSINPWIYIGVGIVAVAAVLYFFVLKDYDITGTWTYHYNWSYSNQVSPATLVFNGDKSSGLLTFTDSWNYDVTMSGSYKADGKKVSFVFNDVPNSSDTTKFNWHNIGKFVSTNMMEGTFTFPSYPPAFVDGTWYAERNK